MGRPTTIYCLSEAHSPITHMAGSKGNRGLIARQKVATKHGTRMVPFLSGNALRSCMLRLPGFSWLCEQCGLDSGLTKPELYFLFGGGAAFEGLGGRESLETRIQLAELCPLAGVLGGVLPRQMVPGSASMDYGILVCDENDNRLNTYLPDGVFAEDVAGKLRPAAKFIGEWNLTRSTHYGPTARLFDPGVDAEERRRIWEASESKSKPLTPDEQHLPGEYADKSGQMIYGGECLIPGSLFAHRIVLAHPKPVEIGAVLLSLALWQDWFDGRVGGMAARGHGILRTRVVVDPEPEEDVVTRYVETVRRTGPEIKAWLHRQFRPELEAAKKKKRVS